MRNALYSLMLVVVLAPGRVLAAPIVYSGADAGANSFAAMTNSQTAAATFDAAAALLGSMTLINFEAAPVGSFGAGLPLDANVTVTSSTSTGSIRNTTTCGFSLCGDNVTSGGTQFAEAFGGSITFTFLTPIQAFGAFFTGLQGGFVGQQTIVYSSGGTQTVNIPILDTGGAFVGFTDAGASITSISINFINDIVAVDDLRYGPTSSDPAVPEPTSLLLLGTGLAGLAARSRRIAQGRRQRP